MSKFLINIEDDAGKTNRAQSVWSKAPDVQPGKRRGCLRIFTVFALIIVIVGTIGAIGGFFYWQSLKRTPQYSLALLVDAARRDDKETVSQIVDTTEVVNNFIPQISDKAVELYGRNLPAPVLAKLAQMIAPFIPGIKEKAKAELPQLIRDKTEKFDKVPYWMIAFFAGRALEIRIDGDTAFMKSKIPEKPVEFTMKRDGNLWKIVAIKDDLLARKVAEKVGQQLIDLVKQRNLKNVEDQLKIENLGNIIKNLNDILN